LKYEDLDVDIRDVQKVQIEILLEFDRICKKNNIKYQLFAGTLLGAIRHKGFIPWDDDIDVCMLRKDYNKFIEACKEDLDEKYFLQTYETDPDYILQYAKIRKNNTLFIEQSTSECQMHHGIYIDIFPLDNIMANTLLGRLQLMLMYILGRINLSRVKMLCMNAKKPVERRLSIVFHYILKIIPKAWTDKLLTKIACIFEGKDTKYIANLTNGVTKEILTRFTMEKDSFYDTIEWEFEGHMFPVPKNYREVLTRNFGDYMKLPPEEERYPHHGIIKIDFGVKS